MTFIVVLQRGQVWTLSVCQINRNIPMLCFVIRSPLSVKLKETREGTHCQIVFDSRSDTFLRQTTTYKYAQFEK